MTTISTGAKPRTGAWYYVITVLSAGTLAWVPFLHAASVLKRRSLWTVAVGYVVAAIAMLVLLNATTWIGVVVMLAIVAAALIEQRSLRREVYEAPSRPAGAVETTDEAKQKRQAARELAQRDPQMASDLRIGRPDLPRQYDDGGLVDLNSASADVIACFCEIPTPAAEAVVSARKHLGRFSTVEEAAVYANLPFDEAEALKDKAIVIARRA